MNAYAVTFKKHYTARKTYTAECFATSLEAARESAEAVLDEEYTAAVLLSVKSCVAPRYTVYNRKGQAVRVSIPLD